jgi:hypothetical protein
VHPVGSFCTSLIMFCTVLCLTSLISLVNAKFVYFTVYGGNLHSLERYSYVFTWTWVNYSCIVGVEVYCCTWSHSVTYTHTRQESSGRGIGPSQRPVLDNTQHSTRHRYPCPRPYSNLQSQQASGHRPTPLTARLPGSAQVNNNLF